MKAELRFFKWLAYILFALNFVFMFLVVNEFRWGWNSGAQAGYAECLNQLTKPSDSVYSMVESADNNKNLLIKQR